MPTITGTSGNDTLIGTSGNDLIEGLDGNDTLIGRGGNDTTDGGPGDDVHVVEDAGDVVIEDAGEGNDTVVSRVSYTLGAGVSVETMTTIAAAGTQAINLTGNALAQSIYGNAGNNILDGGGGADYLAGLGGNDTYIVNDPQVRIAEAAGQGDDEVITSVSFGLEPGVWVETLRTNNAASTAALSLNGDEIANSVYGNAGNNVLNGGGGNDYLVGLEGNDYLIGGGGTDTMLGGTGNDSYTIDLAVGDRVSFQDGTTTWQATVLDTGDGESITILVDMGGGATQMRTVPVGGVFAGDTVLELSGEGDDVLVASASYILRPGSSIELLAAAAGAGGVTMRGNELANSIYGNDANNTLYGDAGSDYLVGGGGNDVLNGDLPLNELASLEDFAHNADIMAGGTGNDSYIVNHPGDHITENVGEGFDTVILPQSLVIVGNQVTGWLPYVLTAGAEVEVLTVGRPSSTTTTNLWGNEFAQTIIGDQGDNIISGGGGADTLDGRGGNDTYYISDGQETIIEGANGGNDSLFTSADFTLNAGAQVETLSTSWQYGDDDIDITGNEFGQRIIGNYGSNVLDGKGGADVLIGLGGADTFAFTTALGGGNVDTIHDFESGIDTIALDDAVFTALPPGDLDPEAFATGTAATEADDRIIYDPATGNLYYDADGNGAGAAELFAHLNDAPTLQATDFSVI